MKFKRGDGIVCRGDNRDMRHVVSDGSDMDADDHVSTTTDPRTGKRQRLDYDEFDDRHSNESESAYYNDSQTSGLDVHNQTDVQTFGYAHKVQSEERGSDVNKDHSVVVESDDSSVMVENGTVSVEGMEMKREDIDDEPDAIIDVEGNVGRQDRDDAFDDVDDENDDSKNDGEDEDVDDDGEDDDEEGDDDGTPQGEAASITGKSTTRHGAQLPSRTRKRRVNFSASMDIVLLKGIAQIRPYAAPRGYVARAWEDVSVFFNHHGYDSTQDTCKNRFQNIMDKYNSNGKFPGTTSEVAEKRRLLMYVSEEMKQGSEKNNVEGKEANDTLSTLCTLKTKKRGPKAEWVGTGRDPEQEDRHRRRTGHSRSQGSGAAHDDKRGGYMNGDANSSRDKIRHDVTISHAPRDSIGGLARSLTSSPAKSTVHNLNHMRRKKDHMERQAQYDFTDVPRNAHIKQQSGVFYPSSHQLKWHSQANMRREEGAFSDSRSRTDPTPTRLLSGRSRHDRDRYSHSHMYSNERGYSHSQAHPSDEDYYAHSIGVRDRGRGDVEEDMSESGADGGDIVDILEAERYDGDAIDGEVFASSQAITSIHSLYEIADKKYRDREEERKLRLKLFDRSMADVNRRLDNELKERDIARESERHERRLDRQMKLKAIEYDHQLRLREIQVREKEASARDDEFNMLRKIVVGLGEKLDAMERRQMEESNEARSN
eukprot:CFRG2664T1